MVRKKKTVKAKKKVAPHTKDTKQPKRLFRSNNDKIIAGVCGGIGKYLGVDPVWIRLIFAFLFLVHGTGLLLYVIAWLLVPRDPHVKDLHPTKAEKFVEEVSRKKPGKDKSFIIGCILVFIGSAVLFENLFGWLSNKLFWPFVFIGLGLYLIQNKKK